MKYLASNDCLPSSVTDSAVSQHNLSKYLYSTFFLTDDYTFTWNLYLFLVEPGPVKFLKDGEVFREKIGDNFAIICQVDDLGNPKGTLQWSKDSSGEPIVKANDSQTFLSLDFRGLTKNNNGSYTCSSKNEVGRQSKNLQLVVLGEISVIPLLGGLCFLKMFIWRYISNVVSLIFT